MTLSQPRGVGVEEADGSGVAFGGETAGLVDELFGEIEGGDSAVAQRPETDGDATGAAAGFEQWRSPIGEETLDENAFGIPQAELMGCARVVDDRLQVIEVGANRIRGYFTFFHAAMNMPLALISCGQSRTWELGPSNNGNGSNSGCATVKESATTVVSERVSVHTE